MCVYLCICIFVCVVCVVFFVCGGVFVCCVCVVCICRSEGNLGCQLSPFTLFEADSLVCHCLHQAGWPVSV